MTRTDLRSKLLLRSAAVALALLLFSTCGDDDGPVVPSDTTGPMPVADLEVIAGAPGSLILTWTAPDDEAVEAAAAYDLRYSLTEIAQARWDSATAVEGEPAPRTPGLAETLLVEGLTPDAAYFVAIRSLDDHGNVSDLSNVVSAVASLNPKAPAAVTDLVATPETMTSVTLTWTAPGADGMQGTAEQYDVRSSRDPITPENWRFATPLNGEPKPQPAGERETFEVQFLDDEVIYYFAMKTGDSGRLLSGLSNVVMSTTQPDTIPPSAVGDLTGTIISPTSVELSWTSPGDDGDIGVATSYDIRFSTNPLDENNWDDAPTVDSLTTPDSPGDPAFLLVRGLENDSTYYFALRTSDNGGNWSALSNVALVGPLIDDVPPAAVADLRGTWLGGTSVRLVWSATGDDGCEGLASSYEVRFAQSPITEATWDDATEVAGAIVPKPCGEPESLVVTVASDTAFYSYAVRVRDDHGGLSGVSNPVAIDLTDTHWNTEIGQFQFGDFGQILSVTGYELGVVIAGGFNEIDGVEMRHVAYWDGAGWQSTGSDLPLSVGVDTDWRVVEIGSTSLYQGDVVIGGGVRTIGSTPSQASDYPVFRRWNGTAWQGLTVPSGPRFAHVDNVFGSGSDLYYAGFYSTYENPYDIEWEDVYYIERMTDSETIRLGEANRDILAIADHLGAVIAGGNFTAIYSVPANHVAMWNGVSWSPMGAGLDGKVNALASDGGRLIAGGTFLTTGGITVNYVAEWDGSAWKALGDGLAVSAGAQVLALEFHNGELYAGGNFSSVARNIRNIAKWDGAAWRGLGTGTNGSVQDMASHGGLLYAVGQFDSAGAQPTNGIAIWEGR